VRPARAHEERKPAGWAMAATASGAGRVKSVGSERLREAVVGYSFIALPMGFFTVFFLFPIAYAFYISRYDWGPLGKVEGVGWENYSELWSDELFWRATKNTLLYTAAVVPAEMALGLFMAVVVNNALRFRLFFRGAFYFPAIASSAAITAVALYLLNVDGLFNRITGLEHSWFKTSDTALWSIAGLNAWTTSGTVMLFYLAYLQTISPEVYEAAAIDGAGPWRTFTRITFPLLKPGHFFVATLMVIGALKLFDQSYIVSGGTGGPNYSTMSAVLYLYRVTFTDVRFGYAAAVGVALFLLIFTLTLVQRLLFGRPEAQ
jgi:multiple sugar transport system permease protein